MHRRRFIECALAAGVAGNGVFLRPAGAQGRGASSFLLSSEGCGRATGYAEANKIVTANGRTHVAWLDSPAEGFRVRIRTLDRDSGEWSPTVTVGEAFDNHGGPALTIDSEGYLHIVYYPHHHAFRYRRSKRPNDASEWDDEQSFGEQLTYPTLLCGADDTLYFTARRRFVDRPYQIEMWAKPRGKPWERKGSVAHSRHMGYAHFQESLAWSPDRQVLHLCCRIHEKSDREAYGRLQTVAYMKSRDFGATWKRSDGTVIAAPVTVDQIEVLARGGADFDRELRVGGMAVDREGVPHVVYSITDKDAGRTVIATPGGDGSWREIELADHVPDRWRDWKLTMAGGLTFNAEGKLIGVATVQNSAPGEKSWGHASNEVVRFESGDGGKSFSFATVSAVSSATSHWLPNIERATGHNAVPSQPGILFTAGPAGDKNTDLLRNKVFWSDQSR